MAGIITKFGRQRGKETRKQRSKEAKKQRSKEAKKQRSKARDCCRGRRQAMRDKGSNERTPWQSGVEFRLRRNPRGGPPHSEKSNSRFLTQPEYGWFGMTQSSRLFQVWLLTQPGELLRYKCETHASGETVRIATQRRAKRRPSQVQVCGKAASSSGRGRTRPESARRTAALQRNDSRFLPSWAR